MSSKRSELIKLWIFFWLLLALENLAIELLNVARIFTILFLVLRKLGTKTMFNLFHFVFRLWKLLQFVYFKGLSKLDFKLRMRNYSNQIHTKLTNVHNKLIHLTNKLIEHFELELPLVDVCIAFNKLIEDTFFFTSHRIPVICSALRTLNS